VSLKKKSRARYAQILAQLASLRKDWAFAGPAELQSLEQELRALAALLFGAQPAPAPVKVRK
jgi:hypothetical protein